MSATGVALLGSTGSIGEQAVEVIREADGRFKVVALAASKIDARLCAFYDELCGPTRGGWADEVLYLAVQAPADANGAFSTDLMSRIAHEAIGRSVLELPLHSALSRFTGEDAQAVLEKLGCDVSELAKSVPKPARPQQMKLKFGENLVEPTSPPPQEQAAEAANAEQPSNGKPPVTAGEGGLMPVSQDVPASTGGSAPEPQAVTHVSAEGTAAETEAARTAAEPAGYASPPPPFEVSQPAEVTLAAEAPAAEATAAESPPAESPAANRNLIAERASGVDIEKLAAELTIGTHLLRDIIASLTRPALDPRNERPTPPAAPRPWQYATPTDDQMRAPLNIIPPELRPRVALRFADQNELLVSGLLQGGADIAQRPVVVSVPVGQGQVVLFANNPIWRGETIGSYFMVWNAILNFDSLNAGRKIDPR